MTNNVDDFRKSIKTLNSALAQFAECLKAVLASPCAETPAVDKPGAAEKKATAKSRRPKRKKINA